MARISKYNETLLTQEYLKSILNYDEHTGIFTWVINKSRVRIGDVAGSFCNTNKYRSIKINQVKYLLHRLVFLYMEGSFPEELVDHIDNNRLNNTYKNLRKCNYSENARNMSRPSHNTSGVKGVHWSKKSAKYCARIYLDNNQIELGYYTTLEEAAKAYQEASTRLHGEFSNHG